MAAGKTKRSKQEDFEPREGSPKKPKKEEPYSDSGGDMDAEPPLEPPPLEPPEAFKPEKAPDVADDEDGDTTASESEPEATEEANSPAPAADDEANETQMGRHITERLTGLAQKRSGIQPINCREVTLSVQDLRQVYERVTQQTAPADKDKDWFCSMMTTGALWDNDLTARRTNRAFTNAVREFRLAKFVKWGETFPDPFYEDADHKIPRSPASFMKAIQTSMMSTPGLFKIPAANELTQMCTSTSALGEKATLTAYQNFIRNYITPHWPASMGGSGRGNPLGGVLLWHSVGAGKTCSYIAAASSSFELVGWHIVLATKTGQSEDFLKNVFDTVCHASFGEQLAKATPGQRQKFRGMSRQERASEFASRYGNHTCKWMSENPSTGRTVAPMQGWTYQRMTNYLIGNSNSAPDVQQLKACQKKDGGKIDPLHKVLFIIDEAHNFINTQFYRDGKFNKEKWDRMIAMIRQSRDRSRHNGVRFILATATPQNPHPANLFRLLNMMTTQNPTLLPVTDEGYAQWVENLPDSSTWPSILNMSSGNSLRLEQKAVYNFFLVSRGLVSYIDATSDVSHFPHQMEDRRVLVRLTEHQAKAVQKCVETMGRTLVSRQKSKPTDTATPPKRKWGKQAEHNPEMRFSDCVRQASNFANSSLTRYHFDAPDYDAQALRNEMPMISEKMVMLLNLIDERDSDDREQSLKQNKRPRPMKHVIYTRLAKDARMLMSCLLADGDYESALHVNKKGKLDILNKRSGAYNFGLLSKDAEMWGQVQDEKIRTRIIAAFNSRENAHGAIMRFVIIDESMSEGVDLMNVSHLHIFEPTNTDIQMRALIEDSKPLDVWDDSISKQIVGRVSRFCGSKFLDFNNTLAADGKPIGWSLTIDRYYEVFDKHDRAKLGGVRTPMELMIETGALDLDYLKRLGNQVKIRNLAIMSAVDRLLWNAVRMQAGYTHEEADPYAAAKNNVGAVQQATTLAENLDQDEDVLAPRPVKQGPERKEWEEDENDSESEVEEDENRQRFAEEESRIY